jgi:hypothetical protein
LAAAWVRAAAHLNKRRNIIRDAASVLILLDQHASLTRLRSGEPGRGFLGRPSKATPSRLPAIVPVSRLARTNETPQSVA